MHLLADISGHGLGHLAQAAPVLNALGRARPGLRLTVRSGLSRERLARRIEHPFGPLPEASDFGFVMANALDIDLAASAARYQAFHADWPDRVAGEAAALRSLAPDLVLTDVAYLPLAGAAAAGIPALAMSSLNWADLFLHYFSHEPWAAGIHGQILAAYRSARAFLRLAPAMPMAEFGNTVAIGPVAGRATRSRAQVADKLGLPPDRRWVLIALGGFDFPLPVGDWPRRDDILWIAPAAWNARRDDVASFDENALPFTDLLAAADAVVTKPGYGTFAEAAVNGTPVLYLRRPDWPEEAALIPWLQANDRAREIGRDQARRGDLLPALDDLWAMAAPPRPEPEGIGQVVAALLEFLP